MSRTMSRTMSAATTTSYVEVTEQPGQMASRIQLEMLDARYAWAADQARGKDVLEAACGAGMGLPVVANAARSVRAGDVDAQILRAACAACHGRSNIALRTFRAQELPYPGESFDLVLLFEAIYYLPDVPRFLDEARRVLRPGGTLLIVTANPEWAGFNPSPFKTRYWSATELLAILQEAGFAARIEGAFPESSGGMTAGIRLIRRAAVALGLVPRTMQGKALLKRIFYGQLEAVPLHAGASSTPPRLEELGPFNSRRHRVLYATAQKSVS